MTARARSLLFLSAALVGLPPTRRFDALHVPEPPPDDPFTCHVTAALGGREALFAPDDGGEGPGGAGGGGASDDKRFTQLEVDRIVQDRVARQNEKIKALEAQATRLAEIEKKLAESDEREAKAREEAELRGKSELEKLQIQINKSTELAKAKEAEWSKKVAEVEAQRTAAEQRFLDHVKRSAVSDALAGAGLIKGASKDATLSFLSEAQIELTDDHQIKLVTVGGKSFDKPAEAAKHFLTEKPYYAEAGPGGSGNPRHGGGGPGNGAAPSTVSGLLSQGLAELGKVG